MARVDILDKDYKEKSKIWRYLNYCKLQDLIKARSLYFTSIKRLERNDALESIHSLPMQKIFTKRDAEYSKKVSATTVSRRKISKIFKFCGVYIML
jgi:hypothetical protein